MKKKSYVLKFDDKNIISKINPKSSHVDSVKYSILISLHYYDIFFHPERISKLKPFEKQYSFIHVTPTKFEANSSNISLTNFDKQTRKIITQKVIVLINHALFS